MPNEVVSPARFGLPLACGHCLGVHSVTHSATAGPVNSKSGAGRPTHELNMLTERRLTQTQSPYCHKVAPPSYLHHGSDSDLN